jgi:translation initiation factor IF-1
MLFRETVAVYCENRTEHTDTLCGQNAVYINSVRTSQETHDVSATKPNLLMLFRQTVAVYCENHTEHTNALCGQNAEFECVKAACTSTCGSRGHKNVAN